MSADPDRIATASPTTSSDSHVLHLLEAAHIKPYTQGDVAQRAKLCTHDAIAASLSIVKKWTLHQRRDPGILFDVLVYHNVRRRPFIDSPYR
jgi:hypothetical protein